MALDEAMWQRFASLFEGDPAGAREIVQLFIDDSQEVLTKLAAALQAEDVDAVKRLAHNMKSTAHQLGGAELSQTSKFMEEAASAGDLEAPKRVHAEFERQLVELKRDLVERVGL